MKERGPLPDRSEEARNALEMLRRKRTLIKEIEFLDCIKDAQLIADIMQLVRDWGSR